MAVKPEGNYMTKPENEWIHDEKGADRPFSRNSIQGRVWLETGENGDQANSATGPNYNPLISGDRAAQGYTVVFSSLTKGFKHMEIKLKVYLLLNKQMQLNNY